MTFFLGNYNLKAEEPPILTNLRDKYLAARSNVKSEGGIKREQLKAKYLVALKKHEADLQRSGDLDGLALP
ncbi:MAG: hypothetical protein P1V20_30460 [Verrucomicrobiales bacterium]|nr:hypothetical protein [Verrucomicrobiales bacterium]